MEPPAIAQTIQKSRMAAPTMKVGLRSSSCQWALAARGVTTAVTVVSVTALTLCLRRSRCGSGRAADPVADGGGPQPWAERDEQQVGRERGQGVDDADGERAALQQGGVLRLGCLVDEVPDALVVEERLHHDQAA